MKKTNCRNVSKISAKGDYKLRDFFLLGKSDFYWAEFCENSCLRIFY